MGKNFKPGNPDTDPFADRQANSRILEQLLKQMVEQEFGSLPYANYTTAGVDPGNPNSKTVITQSPATDEIMDMWWHTQDGRRMKASEMTTNHLYNSLRLLYNQSVPSQYRICHLTKEIARVRGESKKAIKILFHLLTERFRDPQRDHEFTDNMIEGMQLMSQIIKEKL